ncbi:MAG TPA: hypothetical protein VGA37_08535 [Gemmatimonadales bacterium]
MITPDDLARDANPLAPFYQHFRVGERLLLTGHSHQAWPDVGFHAHRQAWEDAAQYVDDKWERAFAMAARVREGYARLLADSRGHMALASSTHDLVVRFLSALPLRERPRIVTTDGEYHSLRRQLKRLEEEGIDVVWVPMDPVEDLASRLAVAVNDRTAAACVSAVLFRSARIVPRLAAVQDACVRHGAELFVDAYHAVNVVPFSIPDARLERAFVVGGGYKYCQLGEGNCFLRFPEESAHRPVVTGWFSEFSALATSVEHDRTAYGQGDDRFAGATYDPTSHYRAAAVFDFFAEQALTPDVLRAASQHQVGVLAAAFDALDLPPGVIDRDRHVPLEAIGGFLALATPYAETVCAGLRARGVLTDYRDRTLRFGPAPYLSDRQLRDAIGHLGETVRALTP